MKKFTLVRYLKTSSRNFKYKKKVELPGTPAIENGIKLKNGTFLLVRCLTYCEDGRIFILVDNEPLVKDNEVDSKTREYEQDGWVLAD